MEQTVYLRKANLRDIPAILEIEQECFREDSFSREQFTYLIGRSKADYSLYLVVASCGNSLSENIFDSCPSGFQRSETGAVTDGTDDCYSS